MDDNETLRVLRSIDRRLALLTGAQEREMRGRLTADLLSTPARRAMFDAIDGRRGSPELAREAGVSDRAAQLFVKELLDLGLVTEVPGGTGRAVIVTLNQDALVEWYLARTTT